MVYVCSFRSLFRFSYCLLCSRFLHSVGNFTIAFFTTLLFLMMCWTPLIIGYLWHDHQHHSIFYFAFELHSPQSSANQTNRYRSKSMKSHVFISTTQNENKQNEKKANREKWNEGRGRKKEAEHTKVKNTINCLELRHLPFDSLVAMKFNVYIGETCRWITKFNVKTTANVWFA